MAMQSVPSSTIYGETVMTNKLFIIELRDHLFTHAPGCIRLWHVFSDAASLAPNLLVSATEDGSSLQ